MELGLVEVIYRKINDEGKEVPYHRTGRTRRHWSCVNRLDDPTTPEDETSTCFTDVYRFEIRAQDVGKQFGKAFRDLMWHNMKKDPEVIGAGNDGAFDD